MYTLTPPSPSCMILVNSYLYLIFISWSSLAVDKTSYVSVVYLITKGHSTPKWSLTNPIPVVKRCCVKFFRRQRLQTERHSGKHHVCNLSRCGFSPLPGVWHSDTPYATLYIVRISQINSIFSRGFKQGSHWIN